MARQTAKKTENLLKQLGADKKKQSKIITKELKEKKSRLSEVDRLCKQMKWCWFQNNSPSFGYVMSM